MLSVSFSQGEVSVPRGILMSQDWLLKGAVSRSECSAEHSCVRCCVPQTSLGLGKQRETLSPPSQITPVLRNHFQRHRHLHLFHSPWKSGTKQGTSGRWGLVQGPPSGLKTLHLTSLRLSFLICKMDIIMFYVLITS